VTIRWPALIASAVILIAGLTGCNSSANDAGAEPAPEAQASSSSEGGTSYPLTLETPYGSTTLESEPTRVAIAGQVGDTENVMSLGVVPVLAPAFQLTWPWIDETAKGQIEQTYEGSSDSELPFETIAAAKPDVIIATSLPTLEQDYDKLAAIAPVVAFEESAGSTQFDWRDGITLIGEALNKSEEAEAQIAKTDDMIASVKEDHPELAGKSISFSIMYGEGTFTFYNGADSPGEQFLTDLGFAPADNADQFTGERPNISPEQIPLLQSDIVVVNFNGGEADKSELADNKLFANLPAVKQGNYLGLLPMGESSPIAWSMARPTAINLQWSIDYLVPQLAEVAGEGS
jgi:iron complex transport system substrate-binding protein